MDYRKVEDVQGWAKEKFIKDTKLGSLARMPSDVLTEEEAEMLFSALEGWLVGIQETEEAGYRPSDIQEVSEADYSCID